MNLKTYHGVKVYNGIVEQLRNIHDTTTESLNDLRRYAREFPNEVDYNLASHGTLLVYCNQIYDFYKECEYPLDLLNEMDNDQLWSMYKNDVGFVASRCLESFSSIPTRMFGLEIWLPFSATTLPIMEWLRSHKQEAETADHTIFRSSRLYKETAIVSVASVGESLDEFLNLNDNEKADIFEYEGMKRINIYGSFYFQIDETIYLCTF